jgi:hypothetical protein
MEFEQLKDLHWSLTTQELDVEVPREDEAAVQDGQSLLPCELRATASFIMAFKPPTASPNREITFGGLHFALSQVKSFRERRSSVNDGLSFVDLDAGGGLVLMGVLLLEHFISNVCGIERWPQAPAGGNRGEAAKWATTLTNLCPWLAPAMERFIRGFTPEQHGHHVTAIQEADIVFSHSEVDSKLWLECTMKPGAVLVTSRALRDARLIQASRFTFPTGAFSGKTQELAAPPVVGYLYIQAPL